MSKFKEFIKKVASKFSTPVKPLAAEVFEENNFKIDTEGNVKANKLQVSWYNSNPHTSEKWSSGVIDGSPIPEQSFVIWNNGGSDKVESLRKLKDKTKSKRIKKKLQKRINTYKNKPSEKVEQVNLEEYTFRFWNITGENDGK